jgi:hypothetical protein
MQLILQGNLPLSMPKKFYRKGVIFSVYINPLHGKEFEACTLQFYHSQNLFEPVERNYKPDRTQPIKGLFFDENEAEFILSADMCRLVSPVLDADVEVVLIKVF